MIFWRIDYENHIDSILSGLGSRRHGGRWSSKGSAMVYLSSSLSLAALERSTHAPPPIPSTSLYAVSVEVPSKALELAKRPHLTAWDSPEPHPDLAAWGDAWLAEKPTLAAAVPSALLPIRLFDRSLEFNLLLNPAHEGMSQVRVAELIPCSSEIDKSGVADGDRSRYPRRRVT
jgi:RES domain-containing protein